MRIIVALPYAPWPVTSGTGRLVMNLLDGLVANHDVMLIGMTLSREDLGRLAEIERPRLSTRAILAPHRRSVFRRVWCKARNVAMSLLAGVPAQVGYAAPTELLDLIARAVDEWRPDLVLASYWHLYRLPELVRGKRLALITHDLDFAVNPERLRTRRGLGRFIAARRALALERIEQKAYERYDTILTVTPADAVALARHPAGAGKVIRPLPLALDLAAFNPSAFDREPNTILLIGTFHADFNRDALHFFLDRILPRIVSERSEARVEVVGYGVDPRFRAYAGSNVTFVGGVEDIRPYIGRCAVMVLPLRFGGGVRIRMMEAAAMGTPVVSTPVGVAGMRLESGTHYAEARTADEIGEAVLQLLADEHGARRLGANARRWAEENISMESYPARLEALFKTIMTTRQGAHELG